MANLTLKRHLFGRRCRVASAVDSTKSWILWFSLDGEKITASGSRTVGKDAAPLRFEPGGTYVLVGYDRPSMCITGIKKRLPDGREVPLMTFHTGLYQLRIGRRLPWLARFIGHL
jgi:hypothetical protein